MGSMCDRRGKRRRTVAGMVIQPSAHPSAHLPHAHTCARGCADGPGNVDRNGAHQSAGICAYPKRTYTPPPFRVGVCACACGWEDEDLSQKLQAGGDEEDMSRHDELLATREKLAEEGKRVKEGVR